MTKELVRSQKVVCGPNESPTAFYVGFDIGGYELGLISNDKPSKEKSQNILSYWGVENIEAEYQRIMDLGATDYELPHNVGGEIMVAGVKDPWGNVVGIIYNLGFKPK